MLSKLDVLDGTAKSQALQAASMHKELTQTLRTYSDVMQLLSHKFVEWDATLTEWETSVNQQKQ